MPIQSMPRQRGAVLIISLIMLAMMSMFVISMLKTSIIELKIGGASHVTQRNFANAEFAINKWINDNNGYLLPGMLNVPSMGAGCYVTAPGRTNNACTDSPTFADGSTVALTPTQIHCGPWAQFGNMMGSMQLSAVQFDVRAVATGLLGGTTTIHQGVQSLAPPGTCI